MQFPFSSSKIRFAFILSFTLFLHSTSAQNLKDNYLEFGIGYGYGMQTQREITNNTTTTGMLTTQNQKAIKFGMGRGICSNVTFGNTKPIKIKYTDNTTFVSAGMGYELELSHLLGSKTKIESSSNTNGQASNSWMQYSMNSFFFTPKFVVYTMRKSTRNNKKISFSFGPSIPVGTKGVTDVYSKNSGGLVQEKKFILQYNTNLGINTSVKFWKYGRGSYFYTEFFYRQNNLYVKTSKLTSSKVNGTEQVNSLSVSARETEFSNTKDYNSSVPASTTVPTQSLTYVTPLASLGFKIGVGFLLQGKSSEEKERRKEIRNKYKEELRNASEEETQTEVTHSSVSLGIDRAKFKSEFNAILTALYDKNLGSIVDYALPTNYTNSWYNAKVSLTGFSNLQGQRLISNYYFSGKLDKSSSENNKEYFLALVVLIDGLGIDYKKQKSSDGERYTYTNKLDSKMHFTVTYNGIGRASTIDFSRY
jgi:hypothetical protein